MEPTGTVRSTPARASMATRWRRRRQLRTEYLFTNWDVEMASPQALSVCDKLACPVVQARYSGRALEMRALVWVAMARVLLWRTGTSPTLRVLAGRPRTGSETIDADD